MIRVHQLWRTRINYGLPMGLLMALTLVFHLERAEKPYVSEVPYVSRHPKGANYLTVDLAELKAMTQELARLFGLALPVSWKK